MRNVHRPHQPQPSRLVQEVAAHWVVLRGRWPVLLALTLTIPAFYLELLDGAPTPLATAAYALAALVVAANEWLGARRARRSTFNRPVSPWRLMVVVTLVVGLLLAAALPPSAGSPVALGVRGMTALLTLIYMIWSLQRLFERSSLPVLLLALTIFALCGGGFWWLEPNAPTLADGLWLAFVTAATVGYGDIVPSTPAAKIFSVFVVLLGWGVLTMITAAISSIWVESSERRLERDILRDMHREVGQLRQELVALREELRVARGEAPRHEPAALTEEPRSSFMAHL
ncbi:MAG TPA: potassium channel family protein [Burkholderiaceae bacterium]|nr:potassium channel family protein [Burkholderiaceae bacterium]HMX09494.1 potassium channel family protein [Burkholderiaceae bacterium]HMZ00343.1 potassium channel family protein [Burkholderiaceae bacterium]HNB42997.1 potassium channel family protein [Burkholderiaceae bacterium]HNG77851.1 potassium channel family protein [Burkholderiaceae bacterium]